MILLTWCIITTGQGLCTWIWLFILPQILPLDKGCVTCIWIFILPNAIPRTMIDINRKLANECIIFFEFFFLQKKKHSFGYTFRYFFCIRWMKREWPWRSIVGSRTGSAWWRHRTPCWCGSSQMAWTRHRGSPCYGKPWVHVINNYM